MRRAAEQFVDAFNDLDWSRFSASWAPEATAFMPLEGQPRRLDGRIAIVAAFQRVFEDVPTRMPGPPYLTIDPRDVEIQVVGEAAVVTFHLGDGPPLSRRTLVFARRDGRWLIVHLHASDAPR